MTWSGIVIILVLFLLLLVCAASEFFSGCVICTRFAIIIITSPFILLFLFILELILDLFLECRHRSLPLFFAPFAKLSLLLWLRRRKIFGGYHLFSNLKPFGSFPAVFLPDLLSPPLFTPEMFLSLLFSRVARFSTAVERYCWHL